MSAEAKILAALRNIVNADDAQRLTQKHIEAGRAAIVEADAPLTGLHDRVAKLEATNAKLLAALQRMLAEFGGDTGGIGAKGRCEALCIAGEVVAKATGESE